MKELLDKYTFTEIDYDYSVYRVIRADVSLWNGAQYEINDLLSRFREKIDKLAEVRVFIKRNRLFWTYQNVKYYLTVSCWATEWDVIDSLIAELSRLDGVSDVAYLPGELD